jgi:hypothetical protein
MNAFHTLAEVAVAIAGFSSLAIVFRGRAADWKGQEYVSLGFAMCWSIGSVFFSLFPIIVGEFGVDLATSSRVGLFGIAAYMLFVGPALTVVRRRISQTGGGAASLSVGLSSLFGVIVVGAIAAGSGLLPGPSHGWFAAAITLLMAHATGELGLLVINVVRQE